MNYCRHLDPKYLPEAIKRVNQLHEWANKAIPELIPIIAEAKKIANNSALSKKDKAKIEPILKTTPFRAYISVDKYSIWFNADITFPDSPSGCHYYKLYWYFGTERVWEPYPIYDQSGVLAYMEEYSRYQANIRKLQDAADEVANLIRPFRLNLQRRNDEIHNFTNK